MEIGKIGNLLRDKFKDQTQIIIRDEKSFITNLLTDSRNYFKPEGTLFFAINTPGGNDGHKYIMELYDKGVRNFVVENTPENCPVDINLFIVPDTIEALTEIGRQNRKNAKEVIAITGSRGKTTIKEMLFQLMEPDKNISRSPRSYNSKIGVPLSLWQIPLDTDLAIIEAGISQKGEMQRLAKAINPDTVIFTNIGEAHSQGFSSDLDKAKEKTKLAFSKNVKRVIYPADNILYEEALKNLPESVERIKFQIRKNFRKDTKDYFQENKEVVRAVMAAEGFSENYINERFKNFHKIKTRLNVSEGINGCSLILDSYTSDFSSLLPAIDFMKRRKMPSQSMTLVISDLHHEGKDVDHTYREMAALIKSTGIKKFIGIGDNIKKYRHLFLGNSSFFKDSASMLKEISISDFNDEIILFKGSPEYQFESIYQQFEAKKHETVLEVNLDALLRNYNYFRSQIPSSTGIICMVKASGYGAGSYEIAKTLQDAGAAYLAVAALDEGIDLRNKGITMPIMIMNPRSANYKVLFNNNLEPVIYSLNMLRELVDAAKKYEVGVYPVHIKLDTGMHRMGFEESDLNELIYLLNNSGNIKVASIFSHLATADCLDMDEYTYKQLDKFQKMSDILMSVNSKDKNLELGNNGIPVYENNSKSPKRHILNSAGILRFPEYHYDLVRLGIGLYGANTLPPEMEKPLSVVSTLRTVIICIREVEGDEAIGYSRKGKIEGKRKIATLPIGYADGMNRQFGNGAIKVMINGHKVPTIGNICMDATMIDVTGIECKEGDSVEIFGNNMSVQELADTLNTIPYEILTSVSPRVKRVYYRE